MQLLRVDEGTCLGEMSLRAKQSHFLLRRLLRRFLLAMTGFPEYVKDYAEIVGKDDRIRLSPLSKQHPFPLQRRGLPNLV